MAKFLLLLVTSLFFGKLTSLGQTPDTAQTDSAKVRVPVEVKYFMVLDKPGKVNRIRFYTGNKITFKLAGEKGRYHGQITDIKKYSIVLWEAEIPLRDIEKISIMKAGGMAGGLSFLGRLLQGAGGLFTLVGVSNYLLDVESGENSSAFLKYSASALVAGYLLTRSSRNRTYKINQSRRLKTIEQFW